MTRKFKKKNLTLWNKIKLNYHLHVLLKPKLRKMVSGKLKINCVPEVDDLEDIYNVHSIDPINLEDKIFTYIKMTSFYDIREHQYRECKKLEYARIIKNRINMILE